MKYLHYYPTISEFEAIYNSKNYRIPWVSLTNEDGEKILNYNQVFPTVKITKKTQLSGNSNLYEYESSPSVMRLVLNYLGKDSDLYSSKTYTIYFNDILYTSDAKTTWTLGTYSDEAHVYLRMSSSSTDEKYNQYIYSLLADGTGSDLYIEGTPNVVMPNSFGEVGDEISFGIYQN